MHVICELLLIHAKNCIRTYANEFRAAEVKGGGFQRFPTFTCLKKIVGLSNLEDKWGYGVAKPESANICE
jgi:hypothetical protein